MQKGYITNNKHEDGQEIYYKSIYKDKNFKEKQAFCSKDIFLFIY